MKCLERDLEECIAYLRFPAAPHRRIRLTNRMDAGKKSQRMPRPTTPPRELRLGMPNASRFYKKGWDLTDE